MIERDFHQWTLVDAIQEIELIIGKIRQERRSETVKFVTGNGLIKEQAIETIKTYGLNPQTRFGNQGVIYVEIE